VRLTGTAMRAYIYPPMPATTNAVKNIIDVYKTPAMEVNSKVCSQHHADRAYRGAAPRQLLHGAPDRHGGARDGHRPGRAAAAQPHRAGADAYKAPSGMNYDSGEFTTVLDKALIAADWQGFDKRRRRVRRATSCAAVHRLLPGSHGTAAKDMAASASSRWHHHMLSGTLDYGQGHATPFAQVLSEKLGIPFERFQLRRRFRPAQVARHRRLEVALVASQAFLEAATS